MAQLELLVEAEDLGLRTAWPAGMTSVEARRLLAQVAARTGEEAAAGGDEEDAIIELGEEVDSRLQATGMPPEAAGRAAPDFSAA